MVAWNLTRIIFENVKFKTQLYTSDIVYRYVLNAYLFHFPAMYPSLDELLFRIEGVEKYTYIIKAKRSY